MSRGRPAIPVYVNGQKHRSIADAIVTTGGTYNGMKKALSLGLRYKGYHVSHTPLEEELEPMKHAPGMLLLPHLRVTP